MYPEEMRRWTFCQLLVGLSAEAVGLGHFARFAERVRRARMLVVQEDRELLADRFTLQSDRLFEQMILHVLRQVAPQADDSLAQGVREPIRGRARSEEHTS